MGFLTLLLVGLVAGFLARLIVPGRDPLGFLGTIILGVVGSFVGGFLGYVLFGHNITEGAFQASGLFGSLIGSIVALLIYRFVSNRKSGASV